MTGWLGSFGLATAFSSAVASVTVAVVGARRRTGPRAPAPWVCLLPFLGAALAVGAAEYALLTHDFAMRFVAENGGRSVSAYYTVTSLWAAHDGSMLLWVLILTGYLAVLGLRAPRRDPALHLWAVATLSAIAVFFAGLALFSGHVFDRVQPVPSDGPGPNPLLSDHPAMGLHPPLLYTGLLGTAVLFSFGVAALISGPDDRRWAHVVRPWALWTWATLTGGIVMGAWWSYAVLGWGGYWAWDPVENAALLPWLLVTALVHAGMVQRRRGALPAWNVGLAVGSFVLAAMGVFLTRSGVTQSVHAFAASGVGVALLAFLTAVLAGLVALVVLRPRRATPPGSLAPRLSRGTALMTGNLLLVSLAVAVLLGTLFPVFADALNGTQVSVGPSYFDGVSGPVVIVLLLVMGVGPYLRWRSDSAGAALRRAAAPLTCGVAVMSVLAVTAPLARGPMLALGLCAFVASGIVLDSARRIRAVRHSPTRGPAVLARRLAAMAAHLGVVVLLAGVAASSAYAVSGEGTVPSGGRATVAGEQLRVTGVERAVTGGDTVTRAHLVLVRDGDQVRLAPALRYSPGHDMTVAVPSIRSRLGGDLYVTLLSADRNGQVGVRVARNPMVGWIWLGGGLAAIAGLCASALGGHRRPRARQVPEQVRPVPVSALVGGGDDP
jgi:cytochrome c-type biogenesis protein CcmF